MALRTLEDALALWRGPALADVADRTSLVAEAARLDELRLGAQEERVETLLALGSSGRAAGEAELVLAEHPLREQAWALLMLALYRDGRQAEALAAFQRARELLADELGVRSVPDLTRLHGRILAQDPALELRGEPLRGYRLLEQLGDGPTGVIFRAIQPHTERDVAVKVIHERLAADPGFVRRFDRDAQVVAALEHPHIVPVYDHWREPGNAYVVTRYLRGGSFEGQPADRADTIRMLEQLAGALASAHRRDIVHGAITGTNVLLDADGNAYLADFPIGVDRPGSTAPGDVADLIALFPGLVSTAAEDVGSLLTNLHRAGAPLATTAAADERNPYKGLRPFTEADAVDFHGRETLTLRLQARLDGTEPWARFLAVVGPSGSGKSSVVRAGLLPALRSDAASSDEVFVADMFPGAHPIDELAAALLRVAVRPMTRLEDLLHGEFRGLLEAVGLGLPDGAELVLVVDQLEELFTLTRDEHERARFLELLRVAAVDPTSRVRVVVTLRADFFDRPLRYPRVGELLAARTEAVPPLSPDELERAIRAPAERAGVSVEPGVVAEIIADVAREPGALPAVQFAVTELYERRAGGWLTAASYAEIGENLGSAR